MILAAEAVSLEEESLRIFRSVGHLGGVATSLQALATYCGADLERARKLEEVEHTRKVKW